MLPNAPVVDVATLAGALHEPTTVVADVRWYLDGRSGREAFLVSHLPGAVFVDLDTVLAAPASVRDGRHPLPDPERFAAELGRLGIPADAHVVAYDDAGGTIAARLWWMLRAIGQRASVLDGGLAAWSGPLEEGPGRDRPAVARAAIPWPATGLATTDEVAAIAAGRAPGVLLDARAPERYRGEVEPVDKRAGHIPGARSAPTAGNLDGDGRFLPSDELARRYRAFGADHGAVAYCGSGVTACHDLLAMEIAGIGGGRLYAGSWSAWAGAADRPVATGPDPG